MKTKCRECGTSIPADRSSCPNCGLLLQEKEGELSLSLDQERRISETVTGGLERSRRFLWGITWRVCLIILTVLGLLFGWGLWSIFQTVRETSNTLKTTTKDRLDALDRQVASNLQEAVATVRSNVNWKFQTPEVQKIVENVAANEAKAAMLKEITPKVEEFERSMNEQTKPLQDQVVKDAAEIANVRSRSEAQLARLQELENTFSNSIGMLPDGRLLLGASLMGRPWVLERSITNIIDLYSAGKTNDAYGAVSDFITRYEASELSAKSSMNQIGTVSLTPEAVGKMFLIGSQLAEHKADTNTAFTWAKRASEIYPNVETKIALIRTMAKNGMARQAALVLKTNLESKGPDAEALKARTGIIGIKLPEGQ